MNPKTKEEILDFLLQNRNGKNYLMVHEHETIVKCDELCDDGFLERCDKVSPERNPVGDFNPSYTYILHHDMIAKQT